MMLAKVYEILKKKKFPVVDTCKIQGGLGSLYSGAYRKFIILHELNKLSTESQTWKQLVAMRSNSPQIPLHMQSAH